MTKKTENQKNRNHLINGAFDNELSPDVSAFNASIAFDKRLYKVDIQGSIAHVTMLAAQGIINDADNEAICKGLKKIEHDIESGNFEWQESLEDVHMNIEAALIKELGETGKKLHTGRSRNDQVATDIRLWLRANNKNLINELNNARKVIAHKAIGHADTIMPGLTHLQNAQPITFGHHLLAWQEMFSRDVGRFSDLSKRINHLPLGSAALAGTSFPIKREMTAKLLDFDHLCTNSLDAVSDRDFAIEFCQNASLLMVHLSRMCEEIILWNTPQFNFIALSDEYTTGSSIMPQKKNPDVAELIRGKSARIIGHSTALLTLMKSQPLAYNKDNQEDKEPLFDTVDTVLVCVKLFTNMIDNMEANKEAMYQASKNGFANATDLADYLVKKSMPFREAHAITGALVQTAQKNNCTLESLSLSVMQKHSEKIKADIYDHLELEACVSARNHIGGTAPEQVRKAAKKVLDDLS